jgi:hypothetical protein
VGDAEVAADNIQGYIQPTSFKSSRVMSYRDAGLSPAGTDP